MLIKIFFTSISIYTIRQDCNNRYRQIRHKFIIYSSEISLFIIIIKEALTKNPSTGILF